MKGKLQFKVIAEVEDSLLVAVREGLLAERIKMLILTSFSRIFEKVNLDVDVIKDDDIRKQIENVPYNQILKKMIDDLGTPTVIKTIIDLTAENSLKTCHEQLKFKYEATGKILNAAITIWDKTLP